MFNYETDVLVIGGGGAGVMAAYTASKTGMRVTLALKGQPQRCGSTVLAPGAIAGVGEWGVPGDSRDLHFADTVKGGSYMNEQSMVRIMVEESPDLIVELERLGALWQRQEDGKTYALRIDGGHSFERCPFLEDRTGREMLRTMTGECVKRGVRFLPNLMILKLLSHEGRIAGAAGIDLESCEPVLLRAKSVVLATGGAGNVYLNTSNPSGNTGDGYALALEAGAALMDLEFVQFYPVGFCFPQSLRGALGALLYYSYLRNKDGERFMSRYDPERMELSTRDRVARAILTEVREGRGGPHGGVYADMTYHPPGYMFKMTPALCETYLKIGVNPEKDWLEVAPTCHFFMGGIKVDTDWATTLPGLYAAGESGAGIHGGNRLSQNALAELLVSGNRAGRGAARYAAGVDFGRVEPGEALAAAEPAGRMLEREGGVRPVALRNRLRRLMWDKAGAFREDKGLRIAQEELKELEAQLGGQSLNLKSRHFNQELAEGLENFNLVTTSRIIVQAALARTESRGAHYRDDHPRPNHREWLHHLVFRREGGKLRMDKVPVDLKEIGPEE